MSKPLAKLPKEAVDFLERHPETASVDAIFADLSGIVRGKRYPIEHLGQLFQGGMALPASVFLLDTMGTSGSGSSICARSWPSSWSSI